MRRGLIGRYLCLTVLRSFLLAALGLTLLLSLLDFTDQLSEVGRGQYRLADAFCYILLTAPSRLLQMAPIAMLLGCLLGLGGLARHSELTAMRSLGFSTGRLLQSLFALAGPVILLLFLLAQFVIPPAQQAAQRLQARSAAAPPSGGFWAYDKGTYLNVQGLGPDGLPEGIDIYEFAGNGSLSAAIHGETATVAGGSWTLRRVTLRRVAGQGFITTHPAGFAWPSFISVKQLRRQLLPPASMAPLELVRLGRELKHQGQPALRYRNALWAQISIPVSLLALLMIAIPFTLGPPRAQSTGQQLTTGGAIGIVFSLCQQIAGYLTLLYNLPPPLTELAPAGVLMAVAGWMLWK